MTNDILQKPAPGELWEAVKRDDVVTVAALFERGADVAAENEECGLDLLMQAIEKFSVEMVQLLRDNGAQHAPQRIPSSRRLYSRVIVHDGVEKPEPGELVAAVCRDDEEGVKSLLQRGADIDEQKIMFVDKRKIEMGDSLNYASGRGNAVIVRLLIKHGADINKISYGAQTPLMLAASRNHVEVVGLLIDSGADVLLRDTAGSTAQHKARIDNYTDLVGMLKEAAVRQRAREVSHNASTNSQQNLVGSAASYTIKRRPQL